MVDLILRGVPPAVATILAFETILRLPLARVIAETASTSGRGIRVMRAKRISDHWKEKAIGSYGCMVFKGSLTTLALLAVVLVVFLAALWLTGAVLLPSYDASREAVGLPALGIAVTTGILYGSWRKRRSLA